MPGTAWILDELTVGYMLFTAQCKQDCIPPSGESYHSAQMVVEY